MEVVLSTQSIRNAETLQQKLWLPLDWARRIPEGSVAEYRDITFGVLELKVVDPKTPSHGVKRYKIIIHHGSAWVSIPRIWMQDRSLKDGDSLVLYRNELGNDLMLFIRYQRREKT